ncbi:hypothetical protein Tsubulata_032972 [Turnera subulata]|uniref:Peptidase C14 caspase domain-containing protein n=1 Tax=Turnera subulata TaxID=218843 RepID=A0A9Q0F9K1_9ROSI|nr:hypothetical protein Tsubulata_032972 [Turnera subulata]
MRNSCMICRERLSVTSNDSTIQYCTRCKVQDESPTNGQVQGRISLISTILAKAKTRISRSSSKYESLNYAASDFANSSSNPEAGPRKRALLIGVTYKRLKYKLKGPIIDVQRMRDLLVDDFNFPVKNIRVLTEEEPNPEFTPNKKNIQKSMEWLVRDCQKGDSLVFYFSGHGLRQPDFEGDESDQFDETILPVDFMQEGMIVDNEIYSTMIRPLEEGVILHAFVDTCHSGTMLDLLYVYDREGKKWKDDSPPSGSKQPSKGGLAISISACRDDQKAADTSSCIGKRKMIGGAMTYILVDILKKNRKITYGELLDSMYKFLDEANQGCLAKRMLKRVLSETLTQKPQLSASQEFDVYKKLFVL